MLFTKPSRIEMVRSIMNAAREFREGKTYFVIDGLYYEVAHILEANGYIELDIKGGSSISPEREKEREISFYDNIVLKHVTDKGYEAIKHIDDDDYVAKMIR